VKMLRNFKKRASRKPSPRSPAASRTILTTSWLPSSGFGVLLEEDLTAYPEMQEMASQITTAARRGQGIVSQLMSYSRKTIKDDKHIRMPVSLDALIRDKHCPFETLSAQLDPR
jgi:hypothetical protein